MSCQGLQNPLDRQADHVVHGSLDAFDQSAAIILSRVGTGLVERINFFEIGVDRLFPEVAETHIGRFHKPATLIASASKDADSRQDLVGAPA